MEVLFVLLPYGQREEIPKLVRLGQWLSGKSFIGNTVLTTVDPSPVNFPGADYSRAARVRPGLYGHGGP